VTAASELADFIAKFGPDLQKQIRACRRLMRKRFPKAIELVYDNYNFLVIGYGPTRRPSESIFSLAAQRSGILLCFLQRGPELSDPEQLLRGSGKVVRNLRLDEPKDLDRPAVRALIDSALELAVVPMAEADGPELIIRSVSAKQRPRR
jgi:hypothetical protein